jgi:hypothetical protein
MRAAFKKRGKRNVILMKTKDTKSIRIARMRTSEKKNVFLFRGRHWLKKALFPVHCKRFCKIFLRLLWTLDVHAQNYNMLAFGAESTFQPFFCVHGMQTF